MFELFQYEFIVKAFLAGSILAILAPIIGQFMVIRRLSGFGDAIAHISLLGFSLGIILSHSPIFWAVLASILGSLFLEFLRIKYAFFRESLLILVTTLALALVSIFRHLGLIKTSLDQFLFGNILTISWFDIQILCFVLISTILLITFFYKDLFAICLDENLAKTEGVKVEFINFLLMVFTSTIIALGIPLFGGLLMSGIVIIPILVALSFSVSFKKTLFLSIFISLISVSFGIIIAWNINLPTSATIILLLITQFIISLFFYKK
jgi:zinc transport system permease protein